MKRILMVAAALICITVTAMAQMDPVAALKYSDRFPQLPPLNVEMINVLAAHYHTSLQQMSFLSSQHDTTDIPQSLMLRQQGSSSPSHFVFKASRFYGQNGDPLKDLRDRIVRKRMERQGRPLPPPMPWTR
jgi:hypothetical protein